MTMFFEYKCTTEGMRALEGGGLLRRCPSRFVLGVFFLCDSDGNTHVCAEWNHSLHHKT